MEDGPSQLYPTSRKITQAIAQVGPISVCIDASHASFQHYKSGVYYEPACSSYADHCVLVVGYGVSDGKDMYIVKNSWGTSWGMDGYMYMSRNRRNNCAIASYAYYPRGVGAGPVGPDLSGPLFGSFCVAHALMKC